METFTGKISIKQILLHNNNWQNFKDKYLFRIRFAVLYNIDKIFQCRTKQLGYHLYTCKNCGTTLIVPHTCKSRFCPSCGKIAVDNWVKKSLSKFPDIIYQHIVFTLPVELRLLCLLNRKLMLNALFKLAADSIMDWAKHKKFCKPGIIAVLHTFGKTLEFCPHIHIIVSSGGLALDHSKWIPIDFFPEKVLKACWKYNVINFIRTAFKKNQLSLSKPLNLFKSYSAFNSFLNMLYQHYIWYVHIGKKLSSIFFTIRYIGRYTKRPVIAETRISAFDDNSVSFWFHDRNLHKKTFVTLPIEEFISKIIRHIPDINFKQIRYFGIFANRVKNKYCPIVCKLINQNFITPVKSLSWRFRMFLQNGIDPLSCPNCKSIMLFSLIVSPNRIRGATL